MIPSEICGGQVSSSEVEAPGPSLTLTTCPSLDVSISPLYREREKKLLVACLHTKQAAAAHRKQRGARPQKSPPPHHHSIHISFKPPPPKYQIAQCHLLLHQSSSPLSPCVTLPPPTRGSPTETEEISMPTLP